MAYTAQYTASDIDDIFVDSIGIAGAEVNLQLATIVALVVILILVSIAIKLFGGFGKVLGVITSLGSKVK